VLSSSSSRRGESRTSKDKKYLHVDLDDTGRAPFRTSPPLDCSWSCGRVLLRRLFHFCSKGDHTEEKKVWLKDNILLEPPTIFFAIQQKKSCFVTPNKKKKL